MQRIGYVRITRQKDLRLQMAAEHLGVGTNITKGPELSSVSAVSALKYALRGHDLLG